MVRRISFSGCRLPALMPIDKSIEAQASFLEYFRIFQQDKPDYPNTFLLYSYSSLASYPGSATIYRNDEEEKDK